MTNELSEEAATIADASLIVRARFVEAADTMAHVNVRNLCPAAVRSLWPAYTPDEATRGHHSRYGMEEEQVRHRPSAAAISRAEEVMQGWLLDYVPEEEHRVLLVRWSMCLAAPKYAGSFRQFCKKTGRVRRTAERRLHRTFQSIASQLLKNAKSLHEPDWSRVSPMLPDSDREIDKVAKAVVITPTHWRANDARPEHRPDLHQRQRVKRSA